MKKLLLTLLFSLPAAAQQQDFSKVEIKATKVAGNVYVLEGQGGNIAATVGDDGVALVDDQYAPLAPKIQAALQKLSAKPVKFVINTHWHGDHTGGNAVFSETATLIANANVRKRLETGAKTLFGDVPPAPRAALPVVTFDQGLSLFWNGEEIKAIHLHAAHTDGDSAVLFTKSNVVHCGDVFFNGMFPFIDLGSGGSVKGYLAALDEIIAATPKDAKVIPGHGPVGTIEDLKHFRGSLEEVFAAVEKAKKAGKTVDQMKAEKILARWDAMGQGFIKTDMFIGLIAPGL